MRSRTIRVVAGLAGSVVCVLGLTACGSSSASTSSNEVNITYNCEMPVSDPVDRKNLADDIAAFEKIHPNVHITPTDENPCDDPRTFQTKLTSGKEENLFYVYDTDATRVIAEGQAADITKYLGAVKTIDDIQPSTLNVFRGPNGHIYGLPMTNYSIGLVYNRSLFSQAGLDPDKPPTTWAEVRADAKKISALGHGIVGYSDFGADNQGGWHFTAELYSQGGSILSPDGKHAAFDNTQGKAVLQNLQQMRWMDNSMGTRQQLTYTDVEPMMGAGKLGMYLAAPDNIVTIVKQDGGSYDNIGIAPMPGGKGTLLGGDGYMFNIKDTPAQIQAGVEWLAYENLTPTVGQFEWQRDKLDNSPVGMPEPDLFTGSAAALDEKIRTKYANTPVGNYESYRTAMQTLPGKLEPTDAQQIYAVLDGPMAAVLTNPNANIDALLTQAANQVNALLADG